MTRRSGFTIVELLIVVVVIAILAAITIVSFNGVSSQAKESVLKSDLKNGATQLGIIHTRDNSYPNYANDLKKSSDTLFQYSSSGGSGFCLTATSPGLLGKSFFIDQGGDIQEGTCPGDVEVVAGTMQTFTSGQCQKLATFTGSNSEAVIGLTDSRGGVVNTYHVAKLADGKCWMLSNLRLGSASREVVLTSVDSNVSASFTLPKLIETGSASYSSPQATGPVPGSTGSGATNYGYMYNWPAATAGETLVSMPVGSGNAASSICPASWRLPTGGSSGEYAMLNAKMNNSTATTPSIADGAGYFENWLHGGPFRGVFSGSWWAEFGLQGESGLYWTSSTYAADVNRAHNANFNFEYVAPHGQSGRGNALAVRCVLN